MYDKIIAGAGTAGLTAAIYALRAGKKVLVLECEAVGGQITLSPCVENYPGISSISGSEFADGLSNQLYGLGGSITFGKVSSVKPIEEGFEVLTEDGETYKGRQLIIATGAGHRRLGLEGEERLTGKGVSYCAVCDGMFFKNKVTAVAGGGNAALQDALYLSSVCSRVYLIHRRDTFRAEARLVEEIKSKSNIECVMESRITELTGSDKLEGVEVTDVNTGETKKLEVSGLFIAIGMQPHNEAFSDIVRLDDTGYVIAGEDCRASADGVFAAGDCRTKTVRQLTTAAADGTICGLA